MDSNLSMFNPTARAIDPPKRLATNATMVLNTAKIPSVLFGWLALAFYSTPKILSEVDIIVNDQDIPSAIATLQDSGYDTCIDNDCRECEEDRLDYYPPDARISQRNRYHAVPAAHFPLEQGEYLLSLHARSRVFPNMEDFVLGEPDGKDPDFILTNDHRLPGYEPDGPMGPWGHDYGVKICKPKAFMDALADLYADGKKRHLLSKKGWSNMLKEFLRGEERHREMSGKKMFGMK